MYKNILVPIDISEESLTSLVVPHIQCFAKEDNSHIHLLSVVPYDSFCSTFGIAYKAQLPNKEDINEAVMEVLVKIVKKYHLPENKIKYHIRTGSPKDQILKIADSINADLVIVGSRRPSIKTYLLGSTASAVVGYAKTSVMIIR